MISMMCYFAKAQCELPPGVLASLLFPPAGFCGLPSGGAALFWRHFLRPSFTANQAAAPPQFGGWRRWRQWRLLGCTSRQIDHVLGPLVQVAGSFWALCWHDADIAASRPHAKALFAAALIDWPYPNAPISCTRRSIRCSTNASSSSARFPAISARTAPSPTSRGAGPLAKAIHEMTGPDIGGQSGW